MKQSPSWEANRFSSSQEIPCILRNPNVHYRITSARHLSLSWASSIQSIHLHPTFWRSLLILSSHLRLGLPSGLFPSGFPTESPYTPLLSPICATCPTHLIHPGVLDRRNYELQDECTVWRFPRVHSLRCYFRKFVFWFWVLTACGGVKIMGLLIHRSRSGVLDGDWGNSSNSSNRIKCY